MKILVTGADGFVGRHLVRLLAQRGEIVTAVTGQPVQVDGAKSSLQIDLTDSRATKDFGEQDAVVHLAGLAAVGPSFEQPAHYIASNASMQVNLFEGFMASKRRPRMLVVSTGSLYDPSAKLPLNEKSPVLASSPYAVSKITQEALANYYGLRGFEVITARPFNHFGPGQGEGFLAPDLAKQIVAMEHGLAARIEVGNLRAKRDYTDVRDIARAYHLMLTRGRSGETYNICSGQPRSGAEILHGLLSLSMLKDPEITTDASRMRPSDNPIIYGDSNKIASDTGWQPEIELNTTLKDILTDWRRR